MPVDIRGCGTALVTPFKRDGSLDEAALRRLVQFQLREGIDFLVPCGTTGENPTLEHDEYLTVVRVAVEEAAGRVPVIAGVGGNNTKKVIENTREVRALDVQGVLAVAPYYNKPTQEGLYQHFKAIAESTDLPVVLYNVPGRTSSNIEPTTVARLSRIANIVAIKEASGSIVQQMEVLNSVEPGFVVLSGDDTFTFPLVALGGQGVVCTTSNQIPAQMCRLTHLLLQGQYDEARRLHFQLLPLMQANFIETNPIPVKAGLAMMGLIEEVYRLPLVPMKPENRAKLEKVMAALGLLERSAAV
ncbi:MAG: 4-hydroxy-tetrahydrodipicolinate synthase [Acidobacteriia bacterium]|nr:4-hydroxy-tetrahydrodipicolinate synthase [Terriglobia bacterium]